MQAETLLVPKRESEAATRALDELEALLKQPEPQTTLVLVAARRSTSAAGCTSCCTKQATVVECGVHRGSGRRRALGRTRVAAAGAAIEPAAARLLAERAGTDVKRLRNDVERLLLYALGQKPITLDDVREIAGPARCRTTGR